MGIRMQPAQFGGIGEVPVVQNYTPASDQTIVRGDVVTWDNAAGDLNKHAGGATVTGVLGIALEGSTLGVVDNPSGKIAVAKAADGQVFLGQVVGTGAVLTSLSALTEGDQYGIIVLSGEFYVDFDDTTNVVLDIVKIDDDLDIVWFKFIDTAVQDI